MMNIAEKFFADRLRAGGHHIYRTDAPSHGDLSVMEHALLKRGYTVLPPGALPAVSLERAKQVCEAHHHTVFPPRTPPALGPWVPHKQEKGKPPHPTRIVTVTPGNDVHYLADGALRTCKVQSFWGWRAERDARHQEPGA